MYRYFYICTRLYFGETFCPFPGAARCKKYLFRIFSTYAPSSSQTPLLILLSLSESVYPEVWVSEVAIAKKLGIHTKTVQRAIKKLEKLKFLSVKRFPGTGEVNRYSLNHDAIRKAIEKVVYGFDPGLSQLLEQVQSGTGNQKFLDFLDRHKLIDSVGTIDLSGLSASRDYTCRNLSSYECRLHSSGP